MAIRNLRLEGDEILKKKSREVMVLISHYRDILQKQVYPVRDI